MESEINREEGLPTYASSIIVLSTLPLSFDVKRLLVGQSRGPREMNHVTTHILGAFSFWYFFCPVYSHSVIVHQEASLTSIVHVAPLMLAFGEELMREISAPSCRHLTYT